MRNKVIGTMVAKMATHFLTKKCHVLILEKFYSITYTEKYILHQQELEHVFEQNDYGVILDAELKLDEHISVKVKKANAIAQLIRKTFHILTLLSSKNYSLYS